MSEPRPHERHDWSDTRVDHAIGLVLRLGVVISAIIVLFGAVLYLLHHGGGLPDYRVFHRASANLINFPDLFAGAAALNGIDIIQIGLLVLIATPMSRVVLAAYAFFRQRDLLYVLVSAVVFAVVMVSVFLVR
ncbi:MAG TPA: DUF1634 domain-containing protein [Nevskiaceae bacterium]